MARQPKYPFRPKSNAYLSPGQYWAIPLSDGRFAAGVVLAVPAPGDEHVAANTRAFLAGLLDWTGRRVPAPNDLGEAAVIADGVAHVKTITETGGELLGCLDRADFELVEKVSHRAGGTVFVYRGVERLRPASKDEAAILPVMGTWGFRFIQRLAETRLGGTSA